MMPGTTLRYEESVVAVLGSLILCKIPSVEDLRGTQRALAGESWNSRAGGMDWVWGVLSMAAQMPWITMGRAPVANMDLGIMEKSCRVFSYPDGQAVNLLGKLY